MLHATIAVAGVFLAILLPGYLLARKLVRPATGLEIVVFAIALGLAVVPTVAFLVAWSLGVTFGAALVLASGLIVSALTVPWRLGATPRWTREDVVGLLAAIATASILLQLTDFHSVAPLGYFGSCLHSIALYLMQTDGSGTSVYDPAMNACVTYVLNHDSTSLLGLGAVICDMRPANGMLFTSVMVLAARATVEVITLLVFTCIVGASVLLARLYVGDWRTRIAVGVVTLVSVHGSLAYMVNENALAFMFGLVSLRLLFSRPGSTGVSAAAGFLVAFVFGLRLPALLWVLPVAFLVWQRSWKIRVAVSLGSIVGALPWLLIPWFLRGDPLWYINEGANIAHDVLGIEFLFRPLNWPFHDELVRVPGQAMPALFYLPATLLKSMGSVVVSVAILGFFALHPLKSLRYPRVTVLLWAGPLLGVLASQVYLDYEKASYALLSLPVLPLLISAFLGRLYASPRRIPWLGAWVLLSLGLAFVPRLLSQIDVAVDPRAHEEYEVINPSAREMQSLKRQSEAERRRELGTFALLPELHEVLHGSELWRGLSRACDSFVSGRVHVRFGEDAPDEARFLLRATVEEPGPPLSFPFAPASYHQLGSSNTRIHLRLPVGPRPTVHVTSARRAGARIRIEGGSGPRLLRWISFYVDERDEYHPSARATVSLDDRPVPTRSLGYHLAFPSGSLDRRIVVTNLSIPAQQDSSGPILRDGEAGTWSWRVYRPDGSVDPGRDANPDDPYWSQAGEPPLDTTRPLLYPY